MVVFKRLFAFYINSSIHVALAVCAFVQLTFLQLGISEDFHILGFVFFGTITGYNFVKYAGIAKLYPRSLTKSLRLIQAFSLLSFIALFFFLFSLSTPVILWAGVLGFITSLYVLPFFFGKTLRRIPKIKVFVIAACWTGTTVFLPALAEGFHWGWEFWRVALQRFLWVVVLMIPFEIRDLSYDSLALETLAQQFGVKGVKILGMVLLVSIIILTMGIGNGHKGELYSALFMAGVTAFLVLKSNKEQGLYYASFWVESIPILGCVTRLGVLYLFG